MPCASLSTYASPGITRGVSPASSQLLAGMSLKNKWKPQLGLRGAEWRSLWPLSLPSVAVSHSTLLVSGVNFAQENI